MELYFSPLACSLATRIAIYEAGAPATFIQVDLPAARTAAGDDYLAINPLGLVPAIRIDGRVLTENAAVLQHVADAYPDAGLAPRDAAGRLELQRWLSFIGTELHKGIYALFFSRQTNDAVKEFARASVQKPFAHLERHLTGRDYLLDVYSVADAYLATILNWTRVAGPNLNDWPALQAYHQRVMSRPAAARASAEEFALYQVEQQKKTA